MNQEEIVLIISTFPNREDASAFCNKLLELGLIACATILPECESMFKWNNTIEIMKETQIVLKTIQSNQEEIYSICKEMHTYQLPEFIQFNSIEASKEYSQWVLQHCSQNL